MKRIVAGLIFVVLTFTGISAWAVEGPITKDQAVSMAVERHPGKVLKAYQETKKGVEVWEVKIDGDDGTTWKVYYKVIDGALFKEKKA